MRLIDADALDNKLETLMLRYQALGRNQVAEDYNFVRTVLLTAPTVDAVEVVRCKDCTQYNGHYCNYFVETVLDNDFCSYGAKMDGGVKDGKSD